MQVEHAVLPGNCRVTVRVDDWEPRAEVRDCDVGASQAVGANGDDLGVAPDDALVVLSQIDELAAAERSPERAIEDQHGVAIAADL